MQSDLEAIRGVHSVFSRGELEEILMAEPERWQVSTDAAEVYEFLLRARDLWCLGWPGFRRRWDQDGRQGSRRWLRDWSARTRSA